MVLQLSVLSQLTAAMAANVAISAATTIRTARDRLLIAFIGHAFQLLLCRYADSDDDCLQMLCRRFPRRAVFNGSGLRNIKLVRSDPAGYGPGKTSAQLTCDHPRRAEDVAGPGAFSPRDSRSPVIEREVPYGRMSQSVAQVLIPGWSKICNCRCT
ncbi:hypothetical protein PJK45_07135 [Mycobacterium kansasii]|uniref:hypothetical protein n=1 Tax=Mycobacterium kansasii TaxID=1768 RepID=UPI00105750D1|nr:hypothetical protein [Mycobacterium kansasii]MXO35270.1 hypothetical protein [Mycobacterium kansasii]UCA18494.1 hypothetical protein LA359_20150 [Mycobacterium kansasii]UGT83353.1 hypothetical protein LTS70_12195 [Mycobacterium kansasii]UGT87629.1 hypothetical protein LTT71_05590 [Mycobacterium kansasii]UGU24104.1 hypothetical protein LT351_21895 [Mycobacterium kansasii]